MDNVTWTELSEVNKAIKTTDIKGKQYAEVAERIKAFRMVYPAGFIETEMVSNENGVCIFKAEVGYREQALEGAASLRLTRIVLGTGTAYEKEGSSFINKTSYIENCETSAVGRALGMAGFGIDAGVASAHEVRNAQAQQKRIEQDAPATPEQIERILEHYAGDRLEALCKHFGVAGVAEMTKEQAGAVVAKIESAG